MLKEIHHFVIVAALGRLGRPSAVGVVEQRSRVRLDGEAEIDALEFSYLDTPRETDQESVAAIVDRLRAPLARGDNSARGAEVVLDVTESGRSIVDLLGGRHPLVVTTGNGSAAAKADERGEVRLSRMGLAGILDREMRRGRFVMAPEASAKLGPALAKFRETPPRQGADGLDYVRDGEADDLVMAAGIACWRAAEFPSRLAGPGGEPEVLREYDETRAGFARQ